MGCASVKYQHRDYVEWFVIDNAETFCDGKPACVALTSYRTFPLCTIITRTRTVSPAELGQYVLDCFELEPNKIRRP